MKSFERVDLIEGFDDGTRDEVVVLQEGGPVCEGVHIENVVLSVD